MAEGICCSFYLFFFHEFPKISCFLTLKFLLSVKVCEIVITSSCLPFLPKKTLKSMCPWLLKGKWHTKEETIHYLVQPPQLSDEESEVSGS